jgi:hypothetical protein
MTPQQQYYPALPLPVFEVPSIFEKFDTDTLFFVSAFLLRHLLSSHMPPLIPSPYLVCTIADH